MENTTPSITVNIERVKLEKVTGMIRHDLRIASPKKPALGYGPYPNYVNVDKIKDNVVIKTTTAKEIHEEFDRRLAYKNDRVKGHNETVKMRRVQMQNEGVDEATAKKKSGRFKRTVKKSSVYHRAYSLILGFSASSLDMLGGDVTKSTIEEILLTALRTVTKEVGIDENELTHVIIHWDETNPHLHAGFPYLDKYGDRFQTKFSRTFFSRLIKNVNLSLSEYGIKPPKTYKDRGKRETHKSTKRLKKETQIAYGNYREQQRKTDEAKKATEHAEAQAKNARAKLIETEKKNSEFEEKLNELAQKKVELESQRAEIDRRDSELSTKDNILISRENAVRVRQGQNVEFEKEINGELENLEVGQAELRDKQLALNKEMDALKRLEKDAKLYPKLRAQVIVVFNLLLNLPIIKEQVAKKTKLGNAISRLVEMADIKMPEQEDPEMDL